MRFDIPDSAPPLALCGDCHAALSVAEDTDAQRLAMLQDAYSANLDLLISLWWPADGWTDRDVARQGWQMVTKTLEILAQYPIAELTDNRIRGLINEAESWEEMRDNFLDLIRVDPWAG